MQLAPSQTTPTSSIIHLLDLHRCQVDDCLDGVYLIRLPSGCDAQHVLVQQADHVLALDAVLGRPADMKGAAELDVSKRPNSVFG